MKINMQINGQQIVAETDPDERLSVLLRRQNLLSIKCGCNTGHCGTCTILLDGKPVPSCIIPAAAVRNSKIITLEYFLTTPMGLDILAGLSDAEANLCGWCKTAKIFAIYDFLTENPRPEYKLAYKTASSFSCTCTDSESIAKAMLKAASLIKMRKRGAQHGKN